MSERSEDLFDVAVIGGGATGYSSALVAARHGLRTVLIAPPARFPPGRTAALLGSSVDFLRRLGVWDRMTDDAAAMVGMRIVDGTRRLLRAPEAIFHASEIGLPAFGHNIANEAIVAALAEAAEAEDGLSILPHTADDIRTGSDMVSILAGDRTIRARLVVGADGARSSARRAAGIEMREWSYPQSALVTTFKVGRPHGNVSTEFHTEHGPFTLVPMKGQRMSLIWMDRPDISTMRSELQEDAFNRRAEERAASIVGTMAVDTPRVVYPMKAATVDAYARNRVMLVGEAAHVFPPIGAQGLNLGFRDVAALDKVLRRGSDPGSDEAIAAYHRQRQIDVRTRTAAVDILNRSLLTDFISVQALRGLGLGLASRVPPLRRLLMRQGLAQRPLFRA
ncbi:FAD-dependent monooxygenase [Faunimonas pinastri]|nr:FAD-dependent monooxygenase [Faunimonas pinastri]